MESRAAGGRTVTANVHTDNGPHLAALHATAEYFTRAAQASAKNRRLGARRPPSATLVTDCSAAREGPMTRLLRATDWGNLASLSGVHALSRANARTAV